MEMSKLHARSTECLFPNGEQHLSVQTVGRFGLFAFVREMPDIDWLGDGGGFEVGLDLAIPMIFRRRLHAMSEVRCTEL